MSAFNNSPIHIVVYIYIYILSISPRIVDTTGVLQEYEKVAIVTDALRFSTVDKLVSTHFLTPQLAIVLSVLSRHLLYPSVLFNNVLSDKIRGNYGLRQQLHIEI